MAEIINKRWEYISFKKGKYILDYFEAPFNNSDSVNFYKNKYRCRPTLNIIFRGLNLEGTISNVNVFEESRCIFKVNCIKFTWFTQYSKLWGNSVHGTVKLEFDNSSIKT